MNLMNMHGKITRAEMKKIMAGSGFGNFSECSVICPDNVSRGRNCGNGVPCSASGSTVCCASDCIDVCRISLH